MVMGYSGATGYTVHSIGWHVQVTVNDSSTITAEAVSTSKPAGSQYYNSITLNAGSNKIALVGQDGFNSDPTCGDQNYSGCVYLSGIAVYDSN